MQNNAEALVALARKETRSGDEAGAGAAAVGDEVQGGRRLPGRAAGQVGAHHDAHDSRHRRCSLRRASTVEAQPAGAASACSNGQVEARRRRRPRRGHSRRSPAGVSDVAWVGYAVPARGPATNRVLLEGRRRRCCAGCCWSCRLEQGGGTADAPAGQRRHRRTGAARAGGRRARGARARGAAQVERIRAYSAVVPLDAGGRTVIWLTA